MPDGRKNNGGARPGSGRKRKADELELQSLLISAWPPEARQAALDRLSQKADSDRGDSLDALKLLLAYAYGKPIERQEHSGELTVVKGYATKDADPDTWDTTEE
jgi:hypothetical protein